MTPYENVTDKFIRKIKQDKEYFCVNGVTEEQLLEIINRRSVELLDDSVNELQPMISIAQDVDFLDKDDDMEEFNFNLTRIEEDLISDMMVVKYFDEALVKLKAMQKYLGDDIKVFSPANERKTFKEMVEFKRQLFNNKLGNYNTRNRETGEFLLVY
ncbi:hypothetical protein [Clostridium sp. 1001283B150210_160208_E6]|jgi:hypothetical protein|uniref:Uncharacterized protein n=1 Tax=Siphoviridae sp. cteLh2 TaxID=2825590 RepID=A0A8S5U5X5_9CAUD|nr:hypothetical protein [Clostridium sp. 1001283B150210_160208_E6]DAF89881.1 MAG TPA: hypothetical protein [Siphoviridae sp. cteLh2]